MKTNYKTWNIIKEKIQKYKKQETLRMFECARNLVNKYDRAIWIGMTSLRGGNDVSITNKKEGDTHN